MNQIDILFLEKEKNLKKQIVRIFVSKNSRSDDQYDDVVVAIYVFRCWNLIHEFL